MHAIFNHESLKAYLAPTGLVSEPRGDLTCRGDLRLEVPKTGLTSAGWLGASRLAGWLAGSTIQLNHAWMDAIAYFAVGIGVHVVLSVVVTRGGVFCVPHFSQ
jgi:hypothetical protein